MQLAHVLRHHPRAVGVAEAEFDHVARPVAGGDFDRRGPVSKRSASWLGKRGERRIPLVSARTRPRQYSAWGLRLSASVADPGWVCLRETMQQVSGRLILPACVCACLAIGIPAHCRGSSPDSFGASRLWNVRLSGEVTGACFVVSPAKEISYFACAGERLAALDAEGRLKKDFKSAVGPVERLIALSPIGEPIVMVGYKNWENSILFLDRQGQLLSEKSTGKSDIDWIAANDQHLLVGFNGGGGLQLFDRPAPTPPLELRRLWSKAGLHNCWNTGLGNFGNGFVAATSETHDAVIFLSADGKRTLMKKLGDVTSLEAVPASRDESLVVAINDINSGREEVIGLRLDRVSFRAPLGKNPASSPVSWRLRRIVPGRFVGDSPQFAVLRGDGSIVVYDTAGTPLSFLPSNRTRQAIELGPPMQGRDTLLACEAKSLSRYVFPMMSKDTARDFATIKNPNAELLKIADGDTADDLWARALWLSISDTGPSPDEFASLFLAALRRAKHKVPIYISFADLGYGPLTLFNSFSGAQETIAKTLGDELKASVPELVEQQKKPEKERDPKLVEDIYKDSLVKSMEQLLEQFKRAERESADRSNVCYLAAVTEDPGNKAAWLRLAYFSTGARRDRAGRVDPARSRQCVSFLPQGRRRRRSGRLERRPRGHVGREPAARLPAL